MQVAKMIFFSAALAWRHARDDPRRALRLAVRLALRVVPGRARPRLAKWARPTPKSDETRDLRALLSATGTATPRRATGPRDPARVLHFVTNALPATQAGYTVRTQRIAVAQRELGLDPHVVTRLGHPLAQGITDARPEVTVDGVSYHRLLPWLPARDPVREIRKAADLAGHLVERLRPSVLHAASNHMNAAVALELRDRYGVPVAYEVRGFLEDSWLSRDPARTENDEFYRLTREVETARMRAADLVVTLGEAMREEIESRGVDNVLVVPNAVDDSFLAPLPDGAALRAELGIAPGDVVVGLTSTFYGFEGIATLIEAAALRRDFTLLLVSVRPSNAVRPSSGSRRSSPAGCRSIRCVGIKPSSMCSRSREPRTVCAGW
jgi:hypothetical protein